LKFEISQLWKQVFTIEVGREAATIVVILTAAILFGHNRRQKVAYFMIIFAVWDIFYYVWLKIFIDWPGSIMDWDILFLIPMVWASPVLAPVLVSLTLIFFSIIIFCADARQKKLSFSSLDLFGLVSAGIVVVLSFCMAGRYISADDYDTHFNWLVFGAAVLLAVMIVTKKLYKLTTTGNCSQELPEDDS
jgi:hypothetical protein